MRIHSNILNERDLHKALDAADQALDVNLIVIGTRGSRSHRQAFEVALRGTGARHKRAPQTVLYSSDERAATFDDWGYFLAEVFQADPDATCGPYKGITDFHNQTDGKY